MNYKRLIGSRAEEFALLLLKNSGYKVLLKNYRNRFGEIDIIAFDKDVLVFVEVKFRSNYKFGLPEDSVGTRKLERIKTVGYFFLERKFPRNKKSKNRYCFYRKKWAIFYR